jgi:hypothetical protein
MNQNQNNQIPTQSKDDVLNKSHITSKTEKRYRDLDNLNRNLMKKVYADLYTRNVKLYQEKDLTLENFLFNFYPDFESLKDFENPNYKLLLERMDLVVKSKFDRENRLNSGKNKNEIIKELNYLSQEDEWALIDRYQKAKFDEEEENKKKEKILSHKKYLNDLNEDIIRKKNYVDPIQKKKNDIYLFDEKEKEKKLEQTKIQNQEKILEIKKNIINNKCVTMEHLNKIEKDNFDINEDNKNLICYKIEFLEKLNDIKYLNEESLPALVDRIIEEKNLEKIKKLVFADKYQKELTEHMDYVIRNSERPNKMSVEERKINKKLLDEAKAYFNHKYKLSY